MKKAAITVYIFIIVLFGLIYLSSTLPDEHEKNEITEIEKGGFEVALKNYKKEIKILAKKYDIPYSYLMALIMLESSGRKNVPTRFEDEVYAKLKKVQNKELDHLENITYRQLAGLSDNDLKDLAKSYGPFQLMGYKSMHLKIDLDELKGRKALDNSVMWINKTYGDYLRKKRFKDAFHMHNAGEPYPSNGEPTTHDPKYVENGLRYMEYFEKLDKIEQKYNTNDKNRKK